MKLELVVLPVSDVDRAKRFYCAIGFREDVDFSTGEDFRVVRLTPPGSGTAIVFGRGITASKPGTAQGLHLAVRDIDAATRHLAGSGVDVDGVFHDIGGAFYHASPEFEIPGPHPDRRDRASFARFRDPDGNGWVLEEVGQRA